MPHVIPTLRYRDAAAAIDFLCDAFGFTRHMVVEGDEREIAHAQLVWRDGMIMLGSHGGTGADDEFGELQVPPASSDAAVTQSPYLVVEDIEAHYERARAAGAEIVMEIREEDYGAKLYSCRDPEGHLWNFGDYDPGAEG